MPRCDGGTFMPAVRAVEQTRGLNAYGQFETGFVHRGYCEAVRSKSRLPMNLHFASSVCAGS